MNLKSIAVFLAACAYVPAALAANLSYTGVFANDNDVVLISFIVPTQQNVTLRTWSYAGGVNAAGQTIARGGFDPIIELFNGTGSLIGQQDDAECPKVAADAVTQQCWDINYTQLLGPGTYTVSLQQYNNYSNTSNLADGFFNQGAQYANFRNGFVDEVGNKRNGLWALDILNASPAAAAAAFVPEPASPLLMGAALVGLTLLRRGRKGGRQR